MANGSLIDQAADMTSIGSIKRYWLNQIAPHYFDFDDVNNYQIGLFGYVNEVMGNTAEDGFNAINVARREFYPITAKYVSSLYKMATLQSIEIPLTTPAQCKCALVIAQDQILDNSTESNGIFECTIDSCLKIFADKLQFMLDYPIKIISKKNGDAWSHTIHYDINVKNSLSKNNAARYLSNKIINENGVNYVIIFVDVIRQLEMQQVSQILVRDSLLATSQMDIDFDGNLANFEVFYVENGTDKEVQLEKVMINGAVPNIPFVFYELINEHKLRLTFKYNSTFVPKYNSEIICRIYTSKGADGNFSAYDGDLICSSDSEDHPYNANMAIVGKVNGGAFGGADVSSVDDLRQAVVRAYATNSTITTSNDLQIKFDQVGDTLPSTNVFFKKKRDDPFVRLFGAYALMHDKDGMIIPTNTLKSEFLKSAIVSPGANKNRIMVKPGILMEYKNNDSFRSSIITDPETGIGKELLDVDPNELGFVFCCPFLIGINVNPNIVGFYLNSVNDVYAVDYTYVNDYSAQQFISSSIRITRNALVGHNFYKITAKLMPATDVDPELLIEEVDEEAEDYEIRAKHNGRVKSLKYIFDEEMNRGYVQATIEYDTDVEDEKIETIQASSTLCLDGESKPGYAMKFKAGETFVENDILATKMCTDKGKLRAVGDINGKLFANGYYIPFVIEDFDSANGGYTLNAYIGCDDELDLSGTLTLTHGVFNKQNVENRNCPVPMKDIQIEVSALYDNDGANIPNKYAAFKGLNSFTLTNTYITDPDTLAHFVEDLTFVRSTIEYYPGLSPENYTIVIDEIPVVQATWALNSDRLNYFIQQYKELDAMLQTITYDLENNFSIDCKFYNTYGKARFYTVGNYSEDMVPLDNVKIRMRFGVRLNTKFTSATFITNFRQYVKDYIESTDSVGTVSPDIYILNLISALKENFNEIAHIEWYGLNSYDHMAQKIISPPTNDFIREYIPEFVNLQTVYTANGEAYPDIDVSIIP